MSCRCSVAALPRGRRAFAGEDILSRAAADRPEPARAVPVRYLHAESLQQSSASHQDAGRHAKKPQCCLTFNSEPCHVLSSRDLLADRADGEQSRRSLRAMIRRLGYTTYRSRQTRRNRRYMSVVYNVSLNLKKVFRALAVTETEMERTQSMGCIMGYTCIHASMDI